MTSGGGFAMAWLAVCGLGLGFALPTAMNAALGALSAEHSGVGSGLITALRMVGGAFGAAILGSVLNAAYRSRLDVSALPTQVGAAVSDSVAAGVAVAYKLGSAALLSSVRTAFVHGLDVALLVCGGVAVVGVVLALAFMPRRAQAADAAALPLAELPPSEAEGVESGHGVVIAK